MAINTQTLFDQKRDQTGSGASPKRFTSDFITAVNRSLINIEFEVGPTASAITDISTDIGLNAKYEPLLSLLVDKHLAMMSGYDALDLSQILPASVDAMRTARMIYMRDDVSQDDSAGVKGKFGDLAAQRSGEDEEES